MRNFKIISYVFVFSLAVIPFTSFAQNGQGVQKGIHDPGTGIESPEIKEAGQGIGQGITTQSEVMLQNQGETQQNQVGAQVQTQTGQENGLGNQAQNQVQNQGVDHGQNQASDQGVERISRVAKAVQEMLILADRNQGIGQQIREIAQAQNQNQEQIENELAQVKNRGRLKKFFFGPDYKNLNSVEERLANHEEKLAQLKQIASQVTNEADSIKLQEQIAVMEQVKAELEKEVNEESTGFSLFGWLNKILNK